MLLVIARYLAERRQSPSLNDIRSGLGVGANTNLSTYIQPLVSKGYLKSAPRYARRSFELTPLALPMLMLLMQERGETILEVQALVDSNTQEK